MPRNKQSKLLAGFQEDRSALAESKAVIKLRLDGKAAEIWRDLVAHGKPKGVRPEMIISRALIVIGHDMAKAIDSLESIPSSAQGASDDVRKANS